MKKIFLSIVIVLVAFATALAGPVKVTKQNKGFWGYYYVTETHNDIGHYLDCSDPGRARCKWVDKPSSLDGAVDSLNQFLESVMAVIDGGAKNGQQSNALYTATWTTNSESLCEILIDNNHE
jgi:hypothetical protein